MYKRRLLPVLFLKDGWMVRSQEFSLHQFIGDPVHHVRRMVQWDVDELIVIDIGESEMTFDHHRTDYRFKPVETLLDFILMIAVECRIPLTFGGRIRSLEDIGQRILNGADKVTVNKLLEENPDEISKAARVYGSQAIVGSIDYRIVDGNSQVYVDHGKQATGENAIGWARRAVESGVGEILLNSIDRDGMAQGYDLETIDAVVDTVDAPVIACGGAGNQKHFLECFQTTGASAVAAGNIYHFTENAYPNAKKFLRDHLDDIR